MPEKNSDNNLAARIEQLENQVKDLTEHTGGMLSSSDFLRLVILDDIEGAKKDFWNREFIKHDRNFIIDPFNIKQLTPFSYDLTVGGEIYSCKSGIVTELRTQRETYWMKPKETVVIKTHEFIALPHYYSATVWPRFKMPTEAVFQSMVKIDPTWYGELGVAIANFSNGRYPIKRGDSFSTLIIYELKTETEMFLFRKENLPQAPEIELPQRIKHAVIRNEIERNGLEEICEIKNQKLKLLCAPDAKELNKLLNLEKSAEWRQTILDLLKIIPRKMDGLGLTTLELIRPKPPKVKQLTSDEIDKTTCTKSELERMAIEQGEPFEIVAAIPDMVMENIDREVTPKVRAEVEADLFPRTVTLTLTVLGFLSLIIAVSAFVIDKFRPQSPAFAEIEWPTTVSVIVISLAAVTLVAICVLLLRKTAGNRAIRQLQKKIDKMEKVNKQKE